MKNILIITNHSFMLWQFRRELIGAMLRQGHRVTISVPFGDHIEDFKAMGCEMIDTPVDRRGINPVKDLSLYRRYRRLLKDVKPDVVVTYSIKPNIYAGFACRQMGIPCCVNVQGLGTAFEKPGIAQLVTAMYKVAIKKAQVVFFEIDGDAAAFRDKGITPASQQKVLRGAGVNLEFYAQQPYPRNDMVHFLYLGRVMQEKGIDELFASVRRLHQEGQRFMLDLVGFYEEGYKDQVDRLVQDGICQFHGFQIDPRPFYAATDCVILPSYHEGMSNVLLVGAAIGRPLITTDIPGCREAVEPGVSGLTCAVKDADSLYDAMKHLLSLTREQREAMGIAGRQRMESIFDKNSVVEQTLTAIFPN